MERKKIARWVNPVDCFSASAFRIWCDLGFVGIFYLHKFPGGLHFVSLGAQEATLRRIHCQNIQQVLRPAAVGPWSMNTAGKLLAKPYTFPSENMASHTECGTYSQSEGGLGVHRTRHPHGSIMESLFG
jgi:hypothetical protein